MKKKYKQIKIVNGEAMCPKCLCRDFKAVETNPMEWDVEVSVNNGIATYSLPKDEMPECVLYDIICNNCGQITKKENECPVCNNDQVTQVNLPYAAKQLTHSLQALGIKMSITSK